MTDHRSKLVFLFALALIASGCASNEAASPAPAATPVASGAAANPPTATAVNQYVAAMRADLSRGKVRIINEVMQLSPQEAGVFWPVYQEYEAELFDLGDQRVEGIRQFVTAERGGKLDNAQSTRLATAYFEYEGKRLELLKKYHGLIAERLSPVRAAQFTQIEHRVGTVVDLVIASELPLIKPAAPAREQGE
jgi:hypothetical protein